MGPWSFGVNGTFERAFPELTTQFMQLLDMTGRDLLALPDVESVQVYNCQGELVLDSRNGDFARGEVVEFEIPCPYCSPVYGDQEYDGFPTVCRRCHGTETIGTERRWVRTDQEDRSGWYAPNARTYEDWQTLP